MWKYIFSKILAESKLIVKFKNNSSRVKSFEKHLKLSKKSFDHKINAIAVILCPHSVISITAD